MLGLSRPCSGVCVTVCGSASVSGISARRAHRRSSSAWRQRTRNSSAAAVSGRAPLRPPRLRWRATHVDGGGARVVVALVSGDPWSWQTRQWSLRRCRGAGGRLRLELHEGGRSLSSAPREEAHPCAARRSYATRSGRPSKISPRCVLSDIAGNSGVVVGVAPRQCVIAQKCSAVLDTHLLLLVCLERSRGKPAAHADWFGHRSGPSQATARSTSTGVAQNRLPTHPAARAHRMSAHRDSGPTALWDRG